MNQTFQANQVTIQEVINHCELSPKAIIVIEKLKFFLKNNEDCTKFVNEYERRSLIDSDKPGSVIVELAREIGSYHYDNVTLSELTSLDEKTALEKLFVEPVNVGMLARVKEHAMKTGETFVDGLKRLYEHKVSNPKHSIMTSLRSM